MNFSLKELTQKAAYSPEKLQKMFFSIDLKAYLMFLENREPAKYCGVYAELAKYVHFPKDVTLGQALIFAFDLCLDKAPGVVFDPVTGEAASREMQERVAKDIVTNILIQPFSDNLIRQDPGFRWSIMEKMDRAWDLKNSGSENRS